jgi:multiple sugar transport system permease protein
LKAGAKGRFQFALTAVLESRFLGRFRPKPVSLTVRAARMGLFLALPGTVLVIAFVAIPTAQTVVYSVEHVIPGQPSSFVGLANYARLFSNSTFLPSLVLTVEFALSFFLISTVLGLLFALLLNEQFRGRALARTLLIVPWATPWVVVGIIWHWFTDGSIGWLNGLLQQVGLVHSYFPFLANQFWAVFLVILAASWRQASLAGLLFLAGLQTIPKDLVEAATADGAGPWQRFVHVTVPWLRPVILVVSVVNLLYGFLQFDVVFIMTQGGPGFATTILSILMYRELFLFTNTGVGSAVAVVLGLTALTVGLMFVLLMHRERARLELGGNY